jgi:hypothetical protein
MPNTYCFSSYLPNEWDVWNQEQGMFLDLVNCYWILTCYLSARNTAKKRRFELEKSWQSTANNSLGLTHRTVRWCTGHCPVPQASQRWTDCSRETAERRGYNSPDCPVVHRTVRWANGASGQRSSARSTRDTWSVLIVGWAHRTIRCAPDSVRCANWSRGPTVDCARYGRKSSIGLL